MRRLTLNEEKSKEILEAYKNFSDNTVAKISEVTGYTRNEIHTVLNRYFDTEECIILESRMNYDYSI